MRSSSVISGLRACIVHKSSAAALVQQGQVYCIAAARFNSHNSPRNDQNQWWAGAAAVTAGAAALAAAAPPVSLADSSAMQQQQTLAAEQAAEAAAERAQHRATSDPAGQENPYPEDQPSPLGRLLQYVSGATTGALDTVQDVYTQVEVRLAKVLQQPGDEPVAVRLMAFAAAVVPVVVASGLAYKHASGSSLNYSLYKMCCLLIRQDPAPEPNFASYLVANVTFLTGFFTLAVLLGVVNDEVQRRADDHRKGRNPVKATDHILILNWNENTPALLQNIAVAIASATTATSAGKAEARRRRGAAAGGLAGDLWGQNPAVVLLADKPKEQMDAAVQEVIRDRGYSLTVHTRQGHPFRPSQLKKVSAHEAAIVVLLHPEHARTPADAEALKAAAAMAFTTLPARDGGQHHRHHKQQRMVVQMPASVPASGNVLRSVQNTSADAATGSDLRVQVLSLPDKLLTNRLVAQTAAQPGLLTVWLEILAPDATSANFIGLRLPQDMEQLPYRDIRRSFSEEVVLGYITQQGTVHLNPADTSRPGHGSKLVLLSNGSGALSKAGERSDHQQSSRRLFEHAAEAAAQRLRRGTSFRYQPRHCVVSAWSEGHMHELMRSFAEFAPAGSTVTFVGQSPPAKHWPRKLGNVKAFEFIQHPYPTSLEALQQAGIKNAACVVLGAGSGPATDAEADARVLAGVIQVQEAVKQLQLPRAPHVVAPICEAGSSGMALRYLDKLSVQQQGLREQQQKAGGGAAGWRGKAGAAAGSVAVLEPEFLIFRNITSAVVAQAASEPSYADIVTALLFSKEGQEVYLRAPASFNIPLGQPISFAEIQELARKTQQTALGYISTDFSQSAPAGNAAASDAAAAGAASGGSSSGSSGVRRLVPWAHSVVQKLSRAAAIHLGLSAADQVVLKDGDYIVVLAEDF